MLALDGVMLIEVGLNKHVMFDVVSREPFDTLTVKFPTLPHVATPFFTERAGSDVVHVTESIAAGRLDCPLESVTVSCTD